MLESADMTDLSRNKLPGIFTVGWHHRTVFVTGHYSHEFKKFLTKHINGIDTSFCFNESKDLYREQGLDGVKAVCNSDVSQLKQLVKKEIYARYMK